MEYKSHLAYNFFETCLLLSPWIKVNNETLLTGTWIVNLLIFVECINTKVKTFWATKPNLVYRKINIIGQN